MAQTNRLRPLGEGELPPELFGAIDPNQPLYTDPSLSKAPNTTRTEALTASMLITSLRALSQRALVALASLFTLATAGSAFALWFVTMPNPNTPQLVGLGMYGAFTLILNWLVLRR